MPNYGLVGGSGFANPNVPSGNAGIWDTLYKGALAKQPKWADPTAANASGALQDNAAMMAKQQAMGQGASPADIQMRAGLMQAQKANQAQAVSTRGNFGLAGAQHAAQTGNAGLQQSTINQAAALRAQEQNQAMAQYLAAANAKRSGDLQMMGVSAQEAEEQAQIGLKEGEDIQAHNDKMLGMAVGGASAVLGGAATSDERAKMEMTSDERAKQEAYMQGAQAGAAQMAPTVVQQWTKDPDVRAAVQKKFGDRISMGGGGQWIATPNGYVPQSAAPEGTPLQTPDAGPRVASGVNTVQKAPRPQYQMYDPKTGHPIEGHPVYGHTGTSLEAFANLLSPGPDQAPQSPQSAPQPAPQAPPGEMTASDERAKASEKGASNAANAFMDTLQPRAFTWADKSVAPNPQAAETPNLGVFAQDVEKSPWGTAIVQNDPVTGYKQLDLRSLMGALAASVGELHRKQKDADARHAALMEVATGKRAHE